MEWGCLVWMWLTQGGNELSLVTGNEKELKILKQVQSRGTVSIYTLIDYFTKKGMDPEQVVSLIYYLAGRRLLELEVEVTEEGSETMVKATPLTPIHLKRKR